MNKNWLFRMLILLALIPMEPSALEYPNRYNSMAETLFDMMDAFSSAYQKKLHERERDSYRYAPSPYYGGAPYNAPPYAYPPAPYGRGPSPLNGSWQGEGGEILVIRNERFRIYLDRSNYREGLMAWPHPQMIVLKDLESGQIRPYEFAESEGRLLLRDPAGNLLRYIRMGW
ncbi:MAG: hypothetical protein OQL20_08865 [Sedimenticola sp.]|nr:hypothetical protein [Sedimenticola sp.]